MLYQFDNVSKVFTLSCIWYNGRIYLILVFSQEATGPTSTCQGSDAIFKCEVMMTANEEKSLAVWSRDGQMIHNTTKHSVMFNGTTFLVVHNASVNEDNGTPYVCSDAQGIISSSTVLNVTGKDICCIH